jgi:hypothetical protein
LIYDASNCHFLLTPPAHWRSLSEPPGIQERWGKRRQAQTYRMKNMPSFAKQLIVRSQANDRIATGPASVERTF